jgi:hypothetical protein
MSFKNKVININKEVFEYDEFKIEKINNFIHIYQNNKRLAFLTLHEFINLQVCCKKLITFLKEKHLNK